MVETRDLPLFAWGEALRRVRARRHRLMRRGALIGAGALILLATVALPPVPRLVWNASASATVGLYVVAPGRGPKPGDMVVAWLPGPACALAAERRYLPANVPAVKRVAAGPGARICGSGDRLTVDGETVAIRLRVDRRGRPLPWWHGCRTLGVDQWLLLMADSPTSFDGRYFGPSSGTDILGTATLAWPR